MSYTEQESLKSDSPTKVYPAKRRLKRNVVNTTPSHSSREDPKNDVIEMFTIKSHSSHYARSNSQDTSELSENVFTDTNVSSVATTKNTYRNKINDRFREIREKVGKTTKKSDSGLKDAAQKILAERVRKESSNIDGEFEDAKSRLQLGRPNPLDENQAFFCNIAPVSKDIEEETAKNEAAIVKYVYPEKIQTDNSIFKSRSNFNLNEEKDNSTINLIEQGFYVPKLPKTPIHDEYHHDLIESPILETSRRPELKPLPSEETTYYLKAQIDFSECEEIITVHENILHLQLFSLQFDHHPLFSLEHVLQRILVKLCDKFDKIIENDMFNRTNQKLQIMRELVKRTKDHDAKYQSYMETIKELQETVFVEGKKLRDTVKAILKTWKLVKKVRDEKKYSTTNVRLIILKSYPDIEEEKQKFKQNFDEVLQEFIENDPEADEDEIRIELKRRFKESFKPPGEPVVLFKLQYDNDITREVNDSREVLRRNLVKSTKFFLRIIYNNIEVCKSKIVDADNDFICQFDETISIQLTNICSSITVEIIEQFRSLVKKCFAKIIIKLPPQTVDSDNKLISKKEFFSNEQVSYKHEAVGSGIKLNDLIKDLSNDDITLNTCGKINFSLFWDTTKIDDQQIENLNKEQLWDKIVDRRGTINFEKLSEWLQHKKPDPQDPKNTILYQYEIEGQNLSGLSENKPKYFRLNPYSNNFQFCDPKVFDENIRLTLLQLRNQNEPEFDHMFVPNNIKEIPLNILDNYLKRKAEEAEFLNFQDEDDDFENKRNNGKKQLQQIYIKIFQKCKNYENNLTYESVVNEKILINFDEIVRRFLGKLVKWFFWNPLKRLEAPEEVAQFKSPGQSQQNVSVVLRVISALNLGDNKKNDALKQFQSFVEIEFNNVTAKTNLVEGPNPVWNETLFLPLESLHVDYLNPNSLNGVVRINLYNETNTGKNLEGNSNRILLGYTIIPLSAICFNKIDGSFELRTPTLTIFDDSIDVKIKANPIYLNLTVEISPKIPNLIPSVEDLPCSEVPFIKEHALKWNQNFNYNFPEKKFSVFAIDIKGFTSCIIRYIKPVEPPPINSEGFDVTEEQSARYISLIPFAYYNQFYQSVWLSVDQFLHMMIGSILDHAVALTCYLLALKKEVWLLLGFGIPYGDTAFVLVRKQNGNAGMAYSIYDVVTGRNYSLDDKNCPLKSIYCIVNSSNVWANLQRQNVLSLLRFDLNRKSDWMSLFDDNITAPTSSIHGKIVYFKSREIHDFEIILEQKIKKKFSKLRQLHRTIWNQFVSNTFKKILPLFENFEISGQDNMDIGKKISNQTSSFFVKGQIWNLPFTTVSSIVKKIKMFGIHQEQESHVEFAVAVCVKPYPNNVMAVWIFLASVQIKSF